MNLQEIKAAIAAGKKVYWANKGYEVRLAGGEYLIVFTANQNCIGLTWNDGETLNGKECEFFTDSAMVDCLRAKGYTAEDNENGTITIADPVQCSNGERAWTEFKDVTIQADWREICRFIDARA